MSGKKKKGMSLEEKKKVLLGIYHTRYNISIIFPSLNNTFRKTKIKRRKEPFNLKEIESHGSKLVWQTVIPIFSTRFL